MRDRLQQLSKLLKILVPAAFVGSLIVEPVTPLTWFEALYALLAGPISTWLPAGAVPLGNSGEIVARITEAVSVLAAAAGLSETQTVIAAIGVGVIGLILNSEAETGDE